jgi:hypothetical protein
MSLWGASARRLIPQKARGKFLYRAGLAPDGRSRPLRSQVE